MRKQVKPVPCAHIAAYYQAAWERHKCIGNNLLRHGYAQQARGEIEVPANNLYRHRYA